jgi:hypothetical protein
VQLQKRNVADTIRLSQQYPQHSLSFWAELGARKELEHGPNVHLQ